MYKLPIANLSNAMIPLLSLLLLALAAPVDAQEIYRVVDENGNVTYTDQKPDDNAEPMELPELNVLEGEDGALPTGEPGDPLASTGGPRSMNFRIEQPADGAAISPQGESLQVVMGIDIDVPPTAEIVLVLDGEPLPAVRSLEATIPAPAPGEHRLYARLQTPSGRVLNTTDPVTFTTAPPSGE